jgi:NAD+ synthase (glutamine-hydrolysing)
MGMSSDLRVTLAQLNPTVGDIDGNIDLMLAAANKAVADGASLVVFPELSLTGYYPADLLDEPDFLARVDTGLDRLLSLTRSTPGLHWVVGAPCRREGPGKPLHNCLLVLADGVIRLRYAKQLLPTYNIFDERRHFEPGPDVARVLRVGGQQIGFLICEDGWNDEGHDYAVNPFERLADAAPDLVVSINASPSNIGKHAQRRRLFAAASARHQLPLIYVNQVGGHDQLVYDGSSFAVEPEAVSSSKPSVSPQVRIRWPSPKGVSSAPVLPPASPRAKRGCRRWSSIVARSSSACVTMQGAAASPASSSVRPAVSTAR